MNIQKYRWSLYPPIPESKQKEFQRYTPVLRQLLYNRGVSSRDEAESYLEARLPAENRSAELRGIPAAAALIEKAIQNEKRIAIYGDFDADGITATAIMKSALSSLGGQVTSYIPHRMIEGYGLNPEAIHSLHDRGVTLLITVDCGIRAIEEIQLAKRMGLDVIVTDHHQAGKQIPQADAVINPNQPLDSYPGTYLAGVGVAYKLISHLLKNEPSINPEEDYLDLVALGTIADLVPLVGENRYLVKKGLHQLKHPHRQGILSLMGVAGISPRSLKASHVSYQIAPRLNAAGRLESANHALELLLEQDVHRAGRLAQELEIINSRRKQLMHKVRVKAEKMAITDEDLPPILFAFDPDFNQGVVGLAAGHLAEKYNRPAIVGRKNEDVTVASCRSIDNFNIVKALEHHQDLLLQYGGHPSAAGFSIDNKNISDLIQEMTQYSYRKLRDVDLVPTLQADIELDFKALNYSLLETIQKLSPMGYGNPQPRFVTRDVYLKKSRRVGRERNHLKCEFSDGRQTFDAIAFGKGELHTSLPSRVDILYTFEENEYRGQTSLQLNIKDFKPSS